MRRRVAAGLCAFVLMAALVAYPLRARAMSATAVAASVGGATVLAAYMAACGIYPYSDGQSFGEWGARALTDLVEQYNQNRIERQIQISQLTGYVAGRTIAIARDTWDTLRDLVSWIVDEFHLENNQVGYNIGALTGGGYAVPYSTAFSAANPPTRYQVTDLGIGVPYNTQGRTRHVLSSCPGVIIGGFYKNASTVGYYIAAPKTSDFYWSVTREDTARLDNFSVDRRTFNGDYLRDFDDDFPEAGTRFSNVDFGIFGISSCNIPSFASTIPWARDVPIFSSNAEFWEYCKGYFGGTLEATLSGITADTTTISIPAELAEEDDTEWLGLSVYPGTVDGVAGTGTATETGAEAGIGTVAGTENPATVLTPQAVERIIQQGVEERQRPDVRPVEVEVGEGVTVDEETGELVAAEPGTVVITATDIPLSLGDYAIPSLSTVFPFSIPWDIMRVWQALDAEPRFPLQDFSMTLNVPWLFGDSPPTVRFGLDTFGPEVAQKMDELAFMVRSFLLIIACVGFLIFISQFIKF